MPSPLARIVNAVRFKAERALERFVADAERNRHDPVREFERARDATIERELAIRQDQRLASHDRLVAGASLLLMDPFEGDPKGPKPPTKEFPDIPISLWMDWNIRTARGVLAEHAIGMFGRSGLLVESMLGDDRVQTAFNGYVKNITKCEPQIIPADDPDGAAVATEFADVWEDMLNEEEVELLFQWARFTGFGLAEILWEPWQNQNRWLPRLKIWHPLYIYYRVTDRRYVALTMEGQVVVEPDDPKWFLFTPFSAYRGWLRGAVRACATPWLVRQFALRDWARFSEVHGLPIRLAKVPAQAPAEDKARFFASIRNLGAESVMLLPVQAGQDAAIWDAKLLEATDRSWEAFPGIRDACDQSITLAVRGTNLTTQIGSSSTGGAGSRAAAEVHQGEDQDYAISDRRKFCRRVRTHLMRWYCIFNHGTTDCVPKKLRLVDPDGKDLKGEFDVMSVAVGVIRDARDVGKKIDEDEILERAGVPRKEEDLARETQADEERIAIPPEDVSVVIKVDEARDSLGLEPLGGELGEKTVEEAKNEAEQAAKPPGENSGFPKPDDSSSEPIEPKEPKETEP